MYHHFYLVIDDETRTMSAPVLPRIGDTVVIEGIDYVIEKVSWIASGAELNETPIVNCRTTRIYPDVKIHAETDIKGMALKLARQLPDKKIQAIKELRAVSNLGLKEAKDAIDEAFTLINAGVYPNTIPF